MYGALPHRSEMIPRGDDRIASFRSDTLVEGDPDLVYRARDLGDLKEILKFGHVKKIPITIAGNQTSLTGSSIAFGGLLIWMGFRARLLSIEKNRTSNRMEATAEPGVILGSFQKSVDEAGYFYPPDPTSRFEVQLGGTVGTNASGEDGLLYGSTRDYIRRLKILKADGTEL
ncbi:MAG: FAD-dependent oxidoreductase, partial [Deltaproteobacteria bacterium]|nr:FAD-dependent oxidoreductase [Deltaproteobacteria bacterium]